MSESNSADGSRPVDGFAVAYDELARAVDQNAPPEEVLPLADATYAADPGHVEGIVATAFAGGGGRTVGKRFAGSFTAVTVAYCFVYAETCRIAGWRRFRAHAAAYPDVVNTVHAAVIALLVCPDRTPPPLRSLTELRAYLVTAVRNAYLKARPPAAAGAVPDPAGGRGDPLVDEVIYNELYRRAAPVAADMLARGCGREEVRRAVRRLMS